MLGAVLAGVYFAFAAPAGRRLAAFYLASGGLYFALAFFPQLFELYQQLPLGQMFRRPARFVWMTGFSVSVPLLVGHPDPLGRCLPPLWQDVRRDL